MSNNDSKPLLGEVLICATDIVYYFTHVLFCYLFYIQFLMQIIFLENSIKLIMHALFSQISHDVIPFQYSKSFCVYFWHDYVSYCCQKPHDKSSDCDIRICLRGSAAQGVVTQLTKCAFYEEKGRKQLLRTVLSAISGEKKRQILLLLTFFFFFCKHCNYCSFFLFITPISECADIKSRNRPCS